MFTDVEGAPGDREGRKDVVLIDSLFIMDQFKAAERMTLGSPHTKDIAEVTAVAEAVLPKGSARVSPTVRRRAATWGVVSSRGREKAWSFPTALCQLRRLSGKASTVFLLLSPLDLFCGL